MREKRFSDKVSFTQAWERGREEFKSRISRHEGSIMLIATKEVISIPPTMSIKGAADTMVRYNVRRLPVVDPGTNRLVGIIGSSDIIEFLGGGEKYRIIEKKHKGNFLSAINDSVKEIMVTDVVTVSTEDSIEDALEKILSTRIGGIVVVDDENRVKGIVTERDFVFLLADKITNKKVEDYMTKNVIVASPTMTLGDAAKIMVRNSFRRLPVVYQGELVGIITTRNIIRFIGKNEVFNKIVLNNIAEVLDTKIEEIMSKEVATVTEDRDLGEVAKIMEESGVGTVCVVEGGKLVGILTERDIVRAIGE